MVDFYVLGSRSPDRKNLMVQAGLEPLLVLPSNYNESDNAADPVRLAQLFANKKAESVLKIFRNSIKDDQFLEEMALPANYQEARIALITADTMVVHKSKVYGKASNEFEAFATLSRLQGDVHKLVTAYHLKHLKVDLDSSIVDEVDNTSGVSSTRVKFSPLSDAEIRGYIGTGEWKGRAGCYAIQYMASQFVRSIEGSHTGVIGLPIPEIVDGLESIGMNVRPRA